MWAIRNARGFTAHEKAFLFVVESRGEMRTTAVKAAKDMGMSRAKYYRVRDSLLEKNCLSQRRSMDGPTIYTVNELSLTETHVSTTETPLSPTETKVSLRDNTKKKEEEIEEEREEESKSTDADAPVDSESELRGNDHLPLSLKEEAVVFKFETHEFESRTPADWLSIKRQRPLTDDENEFIAARSRAYLDAHRPVEVKAVGDDW